jgi:hypothetical protein
MLLRIGSDDSSPIRALDQAAFFLCPIMRVM